MAELERLQTFDSIEIYEIANSMMTTFFNDECEMDEDEQVTTENND